MYCLEKVGKQRGYNMRNIFHKNIVINAIGVMSRDTRLYNTGYLQTEEEKIMHPLLFLSEGFKYKNTIATHYMPTVKMNHYLSLDKKKTLE